MDYKGRLVISTAGHDMDLLLCVIGVDGEYLLLADGRHRKVEKPKRKKQRHVKLINTAAYSGPVTNKSVYAFIRNVKDLLNN